jgi:GxxExxY protein
MVELKALATLEKVHLSQAINYFKAHDLEIGLLLNFGGKLLEVRRIMRPGKKQ